MIGPFWAPLTNIFHEALDLQQPHFMNTIRARVCIYSLVWNTDKATKIQTKKYAQVLRQLLNYSSLLHLKDDLTVKVIFNKITLTSTHDSLIGVQGGL